MTDDASQLREVLVRAVSRVCPAWLQGQREDIVQDALLRVLPGIGRPGEQEPIQTTSYLWKAAYTATIDEIRRRTRRGEVALEENAVDRPVETSDPELGLEIRDCLGRLAPPRRRAVGLYLLGFDAREAALTLGSGVKQVQNLMYRGIADLRRCLEAKGIRP
jgi:RNA polymerase sigma-70 factor (ECF subfamily)